LSSQLGNIYTGALFGCLVSLINHQGAALLNKKIFMFSYGSGLAASLYVFKVVGNIEHMKNNLNLIKRLESRKKVTPEVYDQIMMEKELNYGKASLVPKVQQNLFLNRIKKKNERCFIIIFYPQLVGFRFVGRRRILFRKN
jgi:hydroxymethylglutaryl-CoA synthase